MAMVPFLPYGSCHIILLANDVKNACGKLAMMLPFREMKEGGIGNKHRDCKDKTAEETEGGWV